MLQVADGIIAVADMDADCRWPMPPRNGRGSYQRWERKKRESTLHAWWWHVVVVVGAASAGWLVGRWPSGTIAPSTYLATYLPLGLSGMTTATFASKVTWCFVVNGWCRGIFLWLQDPGI